MKIYQQYKNEILVSVLLFILVVFVYLPVHQFAFIFFDDNEYIVNNPHVNSGITWTNITWAFKSYYSSNWHPLTWISHMIDCQLYGLNPGGHHLTNVFFHAINSVLLFVAFYLLTSQTIIDKDSRLFFSLLLATIFAIHPLRVESVAWVSERKDVLFLFFGLLSLIAYNLYVKSNKILIYFIVLLTFTLGLMSKPMLVTFPFLLLLLDFWPLKRFEFYNPQNPLKVKILVKLVIEKLPLLTLSFVSSIVTFFAQKSNSSVISLESLPIEIRFFNSLISYIEYLGKFFAPINLSIVYPYSLAPIPQWKWMGAIIILLLVSLLTIKFINKHPCLLVGWLWYLGTLVPVIGLIKVGRQSIADRYTYLPMIGINIIVCYLIVYLASQYSSKKLLIYLCSAIVAIVLVVLSSIQIDCWRDSENLISQSLNATPNNPFLSTMLANTLASKGNLIEAKELLQKTTELAPEYAEAHNALGTVFSQLGDTKKGIIYFQEAIKLNPNFADAYNNLGTALAQEGKLEQAIICYKEATRLNPIFTQAYFNLGLAYSDQTSYSEAIEALKKSISLQPNLADAHFRLSIIYLRLNNKAAAIEEYKVLQRIAPEQATNLLLFLQKK